jgi:AcrR family transcriptional regulator
MPKIVDHEAYRRQIIEKAIELFEAQGYEGIGMRELAKQVGISKSALYHYFPSKEALFEGVVAAVVQQDIEGLPVADLEAMTFSEKLTAFIDYILAHEDEYARQYAILMEYVRLRPASDLAQPMAAETEQYAEAMAAFLGITLAEARALYHQLTGVMVQRVFDQRQTDLRTAMQWFLTYLTERYE